MYGWAGKILHVDLTTREVRAISTENYSYKYIGGFGMGVALYWDLVASKGNQPTAFDPENIVSVMNSPFSGTSVACSGMCDVTGKGPMPYPEMFTRSSFGGRFAAELKFAGWDGVVVQGRADKPVWIYIENDHVEIRDAGHLWGLLTGDTQLEIYGETFGPGASWKKLRNGTETTQEIKVLCIGPAGEALCRDASLVHEGGNATDQGGFGAVWGSKNLKAIGVIGTGSVTVADPKKLIQLCEWGKDLIFQIADPRGQTIGDVYGGDYGGRDWLAGNKAQLSDGCFSCVKPCKAGFDTFHGWGSQVGGAGAYAYRNAALDRDKRLRSVAIEDARMSDTVLGGALLLNQYGLSTAPYAQRLEYNWLYHQLYQNEPEWLQKVAPGFEMETYGTLPWLESFLKMIVNRENELGRCLAGGWRRGIEQLGRWGEDIEKNWLVPIPCWHGYPQPYDPRAQYHWGLATLTCTGDADEHGLVRESLMMAGEHQGRGIPMLDRKLDRYPSSSGITLDHTCFDQSTDNLYGKGIADMVTYYRHLYNAYHSLSLCGLVWPAWASLYTEDMNGPSPEYEVDAYNALTGRNETFKDLMHKGRRISNMVRAILVLDGRHRDQEVFSPYIYDTALDDALTRGGFSPESKDATFRGVGGGYYRRTAGRSLDRAGVEQSKTFHFENEGWDCETGWPTRVSLESVGLEDVADILEKNKKLGKRQA